MIAYIHHQVTLLARISLTLLLSLSSIAPGKSLNYILCPHRADVDKFLLVVHVSGPIEKRYL